MQRPDQSGNSATFDSPTNHGARSDLANARHATAPDDVVGFDGSGNPGVAPSATHDAVRRNSSVPAGAILLVFCMVLYLAILGTEHLVSPSAGAALEQAVRSAYEATDYGAAAGVGHWPQGAAFDDDTEQPIGGHECVSRAATPAPSLHD